MKGKTIKLAAALTALILTFAAFAGCTAKYQNAYGFEGGTDANSVYGERISLVPEITIEPTEDAAPTPDNEWDIPCSGTVLIDEPVNTAGPFTAEYTFVPDGYVQKTGAELIHPIFKRARIEMGEANEIFTAEYFSAALPSSEALRYPELAAALKQRDEWHIKRAEALFEYTGNSGASFTMPEQYFEALRRADSSVLSFLTFNHEPGIPDLTSTVETLVSENYDTASGKRLNISDVVKNTDALAVWLNRELDKQAQYVIGGRLGDATTPAQFPDHEFRFDENGDNAKYFDARSDEFAWTIEYSGISFIFRGLADGHYITSICIFLPFFEETIEFNERYTLVPENYAIEFSGDFDDCFVANGSVVRVSDFASYLNRDSWEHASMFVRSNGVDCIMINGENKVEGSFIVPLVIENGTARKLDKISGYFWRGNSDPERLYSNDELPVGKPRGSRIIAKRAFAFDGKTLTDTLGYVFYSDRAEVLKECTFEEVDEGGSIIGSITLMPGEIVDEFRAKDDYLFAVNADGRIARLDYKALGSEIGKIFDLFDSLFLDDYRDGY